MPTISKRVMFMFYCVYVLSCLCFDVFMYCYRYVLLVHVRYAYVLLCLCFVMCTFCYIYVCYVYVLICVCFVTFMFWCLISLCLCFVCLWCLCLFISFLPCYVYDMLCLCFVMDFPVNKKGIKNMLYANIIENCLFV